ncbi:hypothetical protein [Donghicola sp. XS_ASV15]|uniref:F0F1 ATP synthase subunit B family protein n=1 Tax=Donghicola sp. XS_ASV15 TaxID=3241295 RepID=UPI0035139E6F
MTIDLWTLGLQTINALVLIWFLGRFFFKPVSAIIAERRAAAQAELDHAAQAAASAKAERQAAQSDRAAFASMRASLLEEARAEAKAERNKLLDLAQEEAQSLRHETEASLKRLRADAQAGLAGDASDLAVEIAQRLLARLPDVTLVGPFVEGLVAAVGALPTAVQEALGRDGPALLRVPRALTDAEHEAVQAAFSGALGRPVQMRVEVYPDLIAGLELEAETATVRNHFAADLSRIKAELAAHV